MRIQPVRNIAIFTSKENKEVSDPNVEFEKQHTEAIERRKEEELKKLADWEALINKPQAQQKVDEGEKKNGK